MARFTKRRLQTNKGYEENIFYRKYWVFISLTLNDQKDSESPSTIPKMESKSVFRSSLHSRSILLQFSTPDNK